MQFIWDEAKRRANLAKHGLDFADAETVFNDARFTFEDDRFDYGEDRYVSVGLLKGQIVTLIYTLDGDEVRIISMRKATKHEQNHYF